MKSLLVLIVVAILSAFQPCHADLRQDIVGTWVGSATSKVNGQKTTSYSIATYKKLGTNGLTSTTSLNTPGLGITKGVLKLHDSGKATGKLTQRGQILAFIDGTWSMSGNTLTLRTKATGLFPSFTQTTKITLTSKNKMATSGTASNGGKTSGHATRR